MKATDAGAGPAELARIEVRVGDITTLRVDAIVNAANESLLGGGGVDGAIHRAAGPRLAEHNGRLGGCATGLAVATPSFDLETQGVRRLIHTVGPVWSADPESKLGDVHEDVLLASCYQRTLEIAEAEGLRTLAFPAISTGVYGFPKARAATIAVGHVAGFCRGHGLPERVIFCCFSEEDAATYHRAIEAYRASVPTPPEA